MPIYDAICLLCWHKRAQQQNNSRGAWWAAAPISMLHFLQPIFLMPRAAVVGPNEQRTTHNTQRAAVQRSLESFSFPENASSVPGSNNEPSLPSVALSAARLRKKKLKPG